jgi:multiple sugar transport system substrate-binding protein
MSISELPGGLSRRSVLGLGAAAATAVTLGACGGGDSGGGGNNAQTGSGGKDYKGPRVQLQLWNGFTGGDGDIFKKLVDQFNSEHNNINIAVSVFKWADYYTKLPAAVASGNGPDLALMHVDSVGTNAARNVIAPLDDVAKALDLSEKDFTPVVWKAGMYNNKRYGIPLDMHPLGFFYNKTLMQQAGLDPNKPPQTKDEYAAALAALKGKGIQGHWMTPFPFTGLMTFESLLWQFGGELFNSDVTKATYNSDAGVQALTWMASLVSDGHSPRDVGQDADIVALRNNKNAFNWNGIWQINELKAVSGLEWGVAPLPQIGSRKAAWAGSHQFVIVQQRKPEQNKTDASKVFINWFSQHSLDWAKGGQIPARTPVRQESGFTALTDVNTLARQLDYLHFPPTIPGIGDAIATMETAVNEAVLLKKPPKQALDDAAARAEKVLADNKKKYGG